jgi:hypothetical protein
MLEEIVVFGPYDKHMRIHLKSDSEDYSDYYIPKGFKLKLYYVDRNDFVVYEDIGSNEKDRRDEEYRLKVFGVNK